MAKYNNLNPRIPALLKQFVLSAPNSKILFLLIGLLMAFSSKLLAQDPGKGATKAGFEVDADFKSGFIPAFWNAGIYLNYPTLGDDWSKGATGNAVLKQLGGFSTPGITDSRNAIWQVDGNSGSNSLKPELSTFSGSSNKNGDNIAPGQSPYLVQLGGSTPQKNDLTNTYLHGRVVSGQTWIFYAAETRSVNGASYLDFEYNQNGVQVVPNGVKFNLQGPANNAALNIINGRTVGDILLVINYTGGGNKPIVGIRTWLANGSWSDELSLAETEAFVTTNTSDVDAVAPDMAFAGDGAYSNITGALQMVEGGVNITSLNLGASFNPCNPLSTVTIKTRSSPSYTSELKDYDILQFTALPPSDLTPFDAVTACVGGSAVFSTTVSGDGASAANVQWFLGATQLNNGAKYTIAVNGAVSILTVNNLVAGDAGTYKAKLVNATCGTPEETAVLTVNTTAALTNLNAVTKCPGANETAVFSSTVSGSGATAANVQWFFGATQISDDAKYDIAVSGNTSTLTVKNLLETDEGTYKAKLVNATCGTPEKTATLTINPVPDANAGADPAEQCYIAGGNPFTLSGTAANGNSQWTVFSPSPLPAGVSVGFSNATSAATTVTVTGASAGITITLRLTVTSNTSPSCGSDFDDVIVKVKAQAAGKDGVIDPITCVDRGFALRISSPVAGTTYTVTQPCNPSYSSTGTIQQNGTLLFTGLKFAAGYQIVASIGTCIAAPVICPGECSDICVSPARIAAPTGSIKSRELKITNVDAVIESQSQVSAVPNPFTNKLRFSLRSEVSGRGTLELYNLLGQRVQTVFQGNIEAGKTQNIEYNVPFSQRTNLVYVFSVGGQKTSGKLINLER